MLQGLGKVRGDELIHVGRKATKFRQGRLGTQGSIRCLASTLHCRRMYFEARLSEQALKEYKERLRTKHPFPLTCLALLAVILQSRGQYVAAEAMSSRALGEREKS